MLVIKNTEHFRIEKPSVLTIGTFDGVHLGHQKLLNRLKELKQKSGFQTVILTFDPHPRKVLFPEQKNLKLLTTTEEKLKLMETYGIDVTVVYPFNRDFAGIDAESYVQDLLVKNLKVKHLVIGYDHKFGKDRGGDINTLKAYAQKYLYNVEEISVQDIDSISVSSSKIRLAVENGDIELANKYLGHRYFLTGTVVKGKQLGRTIGYPTANINIANADKLIPKIGVYWVEVEIENECLYGMLNIGKNPTTDTDDLTKIEVNLFNFERDVYGKKLKVNFLKRLRDEVKFNSLDALKTQLALDKENCLQLIEEITHA